MNSDEPTLLSVEREGRVLVLTLNRPDRLNALTRELHERLAAAIEAAAHDPEVGAVVLTGAGRAFCSGGDMNSSKITSGEPAPRSSMEQRADELVHHARTARLLYEMPKPTLAMVNGAAAGAGLALAAACDLRVASTEAVLTTSYAKVALSGDLGISYTLLHLVGPAKARELMLLGDKIDAAEALRIGLVNRVAAPEALRAATMAWATRLADGPAVALRYMKRNLDMATTASFAQVIEAEAFAMARCGRTQDLKEAAAAFREKRAPQFCGI